MLEAPRMGTPLEYRKEYLHTMYPGLTLEVLHGLIASTQQREIFERYFGLGREPQNVTVICKELGIQHLSQLRTQLTRVEVKLVEHRLGEKKRDRRVLSAALRKFKKERSRLEKSFRRQWYKDYRPSCPHCKKSRAKILGTRWQCGRCKRIFDNLLPGSNRTQRVVISLLVEGSEVRSETVRVDGKIVEASGRLEMLIGEDDYLVRLGNGKQEEVVSVSGIL